MEKLLCAVVVLVLVLKGVYKCVYCCDFNLNSTNQSFAATHNLTIWLMAKVLLNLYIRIWRVNSRFHIDASSKTVVVLTIKAHGILNSGRLSIFKLIYFVVAMVGIVL